MLTSNTILQSRCRIFCRLALGAAITLLSAGFVLAISCSSDGTAGNSNEFIAAHASPTPRASPPTRISRTDVDPSVLSPDAVVIAIPNDGEFYIGKQRVERNNIPQRVSALLRDRLPEQQIVYIKAAARVRYGAVISIIDSLRENGIEQIGLVADRREAEFSSVISQRNGVGYRPIIKAIQPTDEVVVTVRLGGDPRAPGVSINSRALFLSELGATLREILAARDDKTVFIEASERREFGAIMQIIDVVKAAGARPIGLRLSEGR